MPYGVMMITGTNLSEDDLPAINTFANQTDLALENVLRMEAIQRQASDLQTSEQRFRSLFENAPIALWEEDFSAAREYLSKLQGTGVKDFRVYFKEHPEAVQECAALVEIKAVNGRTVELFQARDKIQLLEGLPQIFHPESYFIFQEELLALLEGQRYFTTQAVNHTLTGKPMHILLELHFLEGSKESWGRVIVSTIDISPLVNAQEQIQLEADRTTALLRTSACLNAGLELPLVLKVVCEEAAQILNTPVVTLSLYDEETERFYHGADYGLPAEYGQRAQPVPRRYVDELIEQAPAKMEGLAQRQMIVQFDTSDAPNAELYAQYNLSGQVSIALLHDGKLLGRINLHSVGGFRELTVEEIALLGGLADQAAQAISNAQLFSQAQRHLNQVQALRDIDLAIIGSVDLRITLNIVLDQTMNQLAVDAVDILLYNSKTQTLDFMDEHGFLTEALRHTRLRLGEGNAGRVAMERKALYIPDLKKRQTDFLRSPLLQQEGFIDYYALPLISKGQIKGVMELFQRSPRYHDQEWRNFAEIFSTQAAIAIDSTQLFEDLQRNNIELARAYDTTLEGWARALELRDKETEGHARRVVEMTERMAREMAISADEMVHLRRGSLLHDIGKMGVPDSILLKTGSLTEDEWEIMRQHPVYAWNLLSPISYLRPALDIPYCHHEKWDGTGYPRGLRGEEIPLPARIFAIVDVWDALNSDRPYRKAWQEEMVLEYLKEQAGKHFDPQVVEVFLKILTDNNLPRKS
jgi:HD-GYP domain-containing protein (c-di-GMP phosphodiesterase class II)/PAS domain-containing protein